MSKKYWPVGFVQCAQGIRGEIFIHLFSEEADWWQDPVELYYLNPEQMSSVGLKPKERIDQSWLEPKTVSSLPLKDARLHLKKGKAGIVVNSPMLPDRNHAEALAEQKCIIVVPEEWLTSEDPEDFFLGEILNFEVFGMSGELLGTVNGFGTNGEQDLIEVLTPRGLFDVPLVEPLLVEVNFDKKCLTMDLPVGLLGEDDAE